jgi:LPS O-antigen subunit length determinant protein (WzzB/FepE family)
LQDKEYITEDEIDLRELFHSLVKRKFFIIIITIGITLLAVIYVNIKRPIYEVKSVVRIGYINSNLVENSNILETKLKLIFSAKSKLTDEKDNAIVTEISSIKNVNNFLEITTEGYSNELALKKNKEVIDFLQNEYKFKIDEFILKTDINIKNIETQIKYVESIEKPNIKQNIDKIKEQEIPRINQEIELLKNVDLKSIENKLIFNQKKLYEYQNDIIKISKQSSTDNSQNMLMSIQLLNTQNLILSIQNTIENLRKEKEDILNLKLKDLEVKKENLINENVKNLEIDLNVKLEEKINNLNNALELEKLKLTNNVAKNSEIIGDFIFHNNPIKPKKNLIIISAFISGLIFSLFLILFIQFINNLRKNDN